MFERMLVALDGTPESEVSLPAITDLARALDTEIHLLGVSPEGSDAQVRDALRARLDEHARRLATTDLRVGTHVRAGDMAEAVLETMHALSADVLAIAAPSGVDLNILPRVDVPVVLVRPAASTASKLERLLVAVDESVGAALALAVAAELVQHVGAELAILRVVVPFPASAFDLGPGTELATYVDPEWDTEAVAGAKRHVDGLARHLKGQGLTITIVAALGNVSQTIVQAAAEMDAQMIVMGTHARSGPLRAALGSVAEAVVQAASVPVLLVREAASRETPSSTSANMVAASGAA